jgi:hypothetical protein
MEYAIEMASYGIIYEYILGFVKIGAGVQAIL